MKDNTEKFQVILDNLINGIFSDFNKAVKNLSKLEILDFVEFCSGQGTQRHIIINSMRIALKK